MEFIGEVDVLRNNLEFEQDAKKNYKGIYKN
jgi:hypothetical protein